MKILFKITWVRLLRELESTYKEFKVFMKNFLLLLAILVFIGICISAGYYLRGVQKGYEDKIADKQRQIDSLNNIITLKFKR